ncbi:peptidoglycan-binding protein LysM [Granulosicoccaceae sp. 1_MG-2023]|nr:peptidoglycan-binding protein LysM [Granulosicoccaceae sp. 1_MG-2023]
MGLLDFASDLGKKIFGSEEEAPVKIKELIEEDNPGIDGLGVEVKDGVVSLSGKAASAEALEKAVLMAGNLEGVSEVNVDAVEAPELSARVEYYEVQSGDTLSGIAKQYLGNAMDYPKIFEANREVIKDPDLIYPGQKIRIPLP